MYLSAEKLELLDDISFDLFGVQFEDLDDDAKSVVYAAYDAKYN